MRKLFHGIWSEILLGEARRHSLVETLRQIPVFSDLTLFELRFVLPILHQRQYAKGELIFREGEAGNGMYIIHSGEVRITGLGKAQEEILYAVLRERQFFGELSLVDSQPRSATAVAAEESVLYGFFKPDLLELIQKQPAIGSKILLSLTTVLGQRLRDTNAKLMELQSRLRDAGEEIHV